MHKQKPSMNAAQANIVARGDDNPVRRGSYPVPLLVNSQFDDPARGKHIAGSAGLAAGATSAMIQGNIPTEDVGRFDIRNVSRTAQGTGRRVNKLK